MDLEILKEKFKTYIDKFDTNDKAIQRKYIHSLRVMELCNMLANENNLSDKDIELSNIIGLLHDYGRFFQWTKYKTYNDLKSIDHADLAVDFLFKEKQIEKFYLEKEYYDEIYDAIKYHNKHKKTLKRITIYNKKLLDIVRDADKIDIFYILGTNKDMISEDDNEINEEIKKTFYDKINLDRSKINNKNEQILLHLSMIFDLNYKESYKYIFENELIDKIYDNIDNKKIFKEYFDYINKYLKEKVSNYVR